MFNDLLTVKFFVTRNSIVIRQNLKKIERINRRYVYLIIKMQAYLWIIPMLVVWCYSLYGKRKSNSVLWLTISIIRRRSTRSTNMTVNPYLNFSAVLYDNWCLKSLFIRIKGWARAKFQGLGVYHLFTTLIQRRDSWRLRSFLFSLSINMYFIYHI